MSRQNKRARKRLAAAAVHFDTDEKGRRVGPRHKVPSRTEPKHGKRRRLPYDHPRRLLMLREGRRAEA